MIARTGAAARLNLGCGEDVRQGYINVDLRKTSSEVVTADLSRFPWPFEDGSASEILILDFLEHFPYAQTRQILFECFRTLDDQGTLVVQVPDATHVCRAIIQEGHYLCNSCGGSVRESCESCGRSKTKISIDAVKRLFGGQDYPGNFHHTTFTRELLQEFASSVGLELISYEEEEHQWKNWNLKARFKKGALW